MDEGSPSSQQQITPGPVNADPRSRSSFVPKTVRLNYLLEEELFPFSALSAMSDSSSLTSEELGNLAQS